MATVDYALLQKELKSSKVLTPSHGDEYHQSLKRWSDAAEKKAAAVVMIQSDEDVSAAVKFAAHHKIEIAVRGGGHGTSGSSSVEGGLVIDLSLRRGVVVHAASKTAVVQGGALWEDVDRETVKHGLACVAGTVNHTGVGGLTLGGGYGWLSGRHGMVVDNTLWIRVVLADGRIVTASKDEHEDLFWALRGAGACFGVAVEFCYQAHPIPESICAARMAFPIEKLDEVVDFGNYFHKHILDPNCAFVIFLGAHPQLNTPMVTALFLTLNGTVAHSEEKMAKLLSLGPLFKSFDMVPYIQLNALFNAHATHGGRKLIHGSSLQMPLDKPLVRELGKEYAQFISETEDISEWSIVIEILSLDKMCEVPITGTATPVRTMSLNTVVQGKWKHASQDKIARDYARRTAKKMKDEGNPNSEFSAYPNTYNAESRSRELFGPNYHRLVQLKQKYDPGNMFHSWHDLSGTRDNKLSFEHR